MTQELCSAERLMVGGGSLQQAPKELSLLRTNQQDQTGIYIAQISATDAHMGLHICKKYCAGDWFNIFINNQTDSLIEKKDMSVHVGLIVQWLPAMMTSC